jgi:hypothetical protein
MSMGVEIYIPRQKLNEMLKLTFAGSGPGPTVELGPFEEVAFDGNDLYALVEGRPRIARHADHYWFVDGEKFFRVDCNTAVEAQFQDGAGKVTEVLGPFVHFSSADGIAYGDGQNFAHIDPHSGRWFSHLHRSHWNRLVIRAV